jgi:hypothetical protein
LTIAEKIVSASVDPVVIIPASVSVPTATPAPKDPLPRSAAPMVSPIPVIKPVIKPVQNSEGQAPPEQVSLPVTPAPTAVRPTATLIPPTETDWQSDFLATLTQGTVAALRQMPLSDATSGPAPEPTAEPAADATSIYTVIKDALAQGQSTDQIDSLLNDSLRATSVTLPTELIQPDGRIDTAGIISILSGK